MTLRKRPLDITALAGGAFRDAQFRLFFIGIFFAVGINPQELPYVWQSPMGTRISRRILLVCISAAFSFTYATIITVAAHYIINASSGEANPPSTIEATRPRMVAATSAPAALMTAGIGRR